MKYERITGKSCLCVCVYVLGYACMGVFVCVAGASSSSAVVVVIVGVGFHSADKWTRTTKGGRPRLTGRQARRTGKEANEQAKVQREGMRNRVLKSAEGERETRRECKLRQRHRARSPFCIRRQIAVQGKRQCCRGKEGVGGTGGR